MTPPARHPAHRDEDVADLPQQHLSALLDGDLQGGDAQAVQRACALWRDDAQSRQNWHAWNLIGDVMRSEELAQAPARDAAFLARLRERLADEPAVLAPAPTVAVAARGWRPAWLLPTAVAAGFAMVAGVLVVARIAPPQAAPVLAATPASGLGLASLPGAAPNSVSVSASASGAVGLIRDTRLDNYLRAHRAARGSPAAAVPGGGMRNVAVTLVPSGDR